jgi:hypothetical protein
MSEGGQGLTTEARAKRRLTIEHLRRTAEYVAYQTWKAHSVYSGMTTPDADDDSISKRAWENHVKDFKRVLREGPWMDLEAKVQKRRSAITFLKNTDEYKYVECMRGRSGNHDLPGTPDPEDTTTSKRAWEINVAQYRRALKHLTEPHYVSSPPHLHAQSMNWQSEPMYIRTGGADVPRSGCYRAFKLSLVF